MLALMIATELEKYMLLAHASEVIKDNAHMREINSATELSELAVRVADGFHSWLDRNLETTTDDYLIMAI